MTQRYLYLLALFFAFGCPGPDKKKPINPEPKPIANEEKQEAGPDLLASWGSINSVSGAQSGPSATSSTGTAHAVINSAPRADVRTEKRMRRASATFMPRRVVAQPAETLRV